MRQYYLLFKCSVHTLLVVLLLSSCATMKVKPSYTPLLERRIEALSGQTDWQIDGRLAIKNGGEGLSATLHWVQNQDSFDISLYDPLGRKVAHMQGSYDLVSLSTSDGKVVEGADPEALQLQYLGWSLPLEYLSHWVMGLPVSGKLMQNTSYDSAGRLQALTQEGWRIQFKRYETSQLTALPQLVQLEKGDFRVKLLVDERI